MPVDETVEVWRQLVVGKGGSWVLFSHGTCVVLAGAEGPLEQQGIELLKEWGPVAAGSPSGDFSVVILDGLPGWVVTSHHELVNTYVRPDELDDDPAEVDIGLLGRLKRDLDATELVVVHVEDKRAEPESEEHDPSLLGTGHEPSPPRTGVRRRRPDTDRRRGAR